MKFIQYVEKAMVKYLLQVIQQKGGNKIYSFEIENGVILVRVGNKGHSWADFNQLQKVEKTILQTEDGVDIYDGDNFHIIRKEGLSYIKKACTYDILEHSRIWDGSDGLFTVF